MTTNLVLGLLVMAIGLGVVAVQAFQIIREQRSHLGTGASLREHGLTMVFLGIVPILAGMLFLGAWWSDDGQPRGTPTVAAGAYGPV